MGDGASGAPEPGLRDSLARLGSAFVALLRTRFELASLEFDEARTRAFEKLVLMVIAGLAFGFALLGASVLIVVLCWDTHPIAALGGLVVAYAVLGLIALWRLSIKRHAEGSPFSATLAELERDRAWLEQGLRRDK